MAKVDTKTSPAKNTESSIRAAENLLGQIAPMTSGMATGFSSTKKGFDLARIPAKTGLQTGLRVQCCAKDRKPCSCSTCRAKSSVEDEFAAANEFHNSVSQMQSAAPTPASATGTETSLSPTSDVSTEISDSKAGPLAAQGSIERHKKKAGGPCSTTETKTLADAKKRASGWVTAAFGKLLAKPLPLSVSASLKRNFGPTDGVTANLPGIISMIAAANIEMHLVPVTCAGTEDKICADGHCGYTPDPGAHRYVICRSTFKPTKSPVGQAGCVLHEAFHSAFSDFDVDSYSGWGGPGRTPGYPGKEPLKNADSYTSLVIDLK